MRRCCIIYNEPGVNALADELDVLDQVGHIEKHLIGLGISVYRKGITERFMQEISKAWIRRKTAPHSLMKGPAKSYH